MSVSACRQCFPVQLSTIEKQIWIPFGTSTSLPSVMAGTDPLLFTVT